MEELEKLFSKKKKKKQRAAEKVVGKKEQVESSLKASDLDFLDDLFTNTVTTCTKFFVLTTIFILLPAEHF